MTKEIKQEIINTYKLHEGDTGSPEVHSESVYYPGLLGCNLLAYCHYFVKPFYTVYYKWLPYLFGKQCVCFEYFLLYLDCRRRVKPVYTTLSNGAYIPVSALLLYLCKPFLPSVVYIPGVYPYGYFPAFNVFFAVVYRMFAVCPVVVCMYVKEFHTSCFMEQGRIPNLPRDGNAGCVLLQDKDLLWGHVCVGPLWRIANRLA